jgi:hypothetical protein
MPRDPDALFAARKSKKLPFDFVLSELAELDPWTRPMFGCTAVYVGEQIIFILRAKDDDDTGVWVATTKEHHASLRRELPSLRSILIFGGGETGWQLLPADADDFEESVLRACALVRAGDSRIGKVPKPKRRKKAVASSPRAPANGSKRARQVPARGRPRRRADD